MTDAEISKALALAIGWTENRRNEDGCPDPDIAVFAFSESPNADEVKVWFDEKWRTFDYRDPAVIWPIAKATNNFPSMVAGGLWCSGWSGPSAETPEKAVALAVIGIHAPK